MTRYTRQTRLFEVGAKGAFILEDLRVEARGKGIRGEACALYLAGAGVRQIALEDPSFEPLVRALRADVAIRALCTDTPKEEARRIENPDDTEQPVHPIASAYFHGANDALAILRRALGVG